MPRQDLGQFHIPSAYWDWDAEDRREWCKYIAELIVMRLDVQKFEQAGLIE